MIFLFFPQFQAQIFLFFTQFQAQTTKSTVLVVEICCKNSSTVLFFTALSKLQLVGKFSLVLASQDKFPPQQCYFFASESIIVARKATDYYYLVKLSLGNILKIFLFFPRFEPQYSYKKRSVAAATAALYARGFFSPIHRQVRQVDLPEN